MSWNRKKDVIIDKAGRIQDIDKRTLQSVHDQEEDLDWCN